MPPPPALTSRASLADHAIVPRHRGREPGATRPCGGMVEFDRQAWFAQHILVHETRLRTYLRRFLKTPSDVADGIQETYARLLSLPDHELSAIRSPHAFLFTAARNLALEWKRRERLTFHDFLPETGPTCVLDESPSAYEQLGV